MALKYKQAYSKLGEERVQVMNKELVVDTRTQLEIRRDVKRGRIFDPNESYWATRIDENWSKIPGFMWIDRRTKLRKFTSLVGRHLVQLEPANTFNALEVWQAELARNAAEDLQLEEVVSKGKEKEKEKIILKTKLLNEHKRYVTEVTRIRNSKKNLLDILRDIRVPKARAILIIQILSSAFDEYKKSGEKKLLYETLWAVAAIQDTIPTEKAPGPLKDSDILVRDPSLVCDDPLAAEKLLKKARKVMGQETDMVRLQLVEMSDSLPPLTKFNYGLRLDAWQKRVLAWIDAGKSVIICAPTSSGKTVLSSYVAIIFKAQQAIEG
eukprot:CAMPEP_0173320502 /NCGR_PEP_ID=MMETSP1143-20121109/28852_1 /TAXON_ID=483371 /ORGANISM="non described non described, Strain CCMP2298" /LENGTH=323 /DNA_ID=CAMNT_0014264073 /DNA_START=121 /DNA_END=1089 /DNA_ORIENTATION=-